MGFFTKDPKDIIVDAYTIKNDKLRLMTQLNAAWDNFLGFSRANRFVGYELSLLLGHVPREAWLNKTGSLAFNPSDSIYTISTLKFPLQNFQSNKLYILHQYKPVPFQWAGSNQEQYRPYLMAFITIK